MVSIVNVVLCYAQYDHRTLHTNCRPDSYYLIMLLEALLAMLSSSLSGLNSRLKYDGTHKNCHYHNENKVAGIL